MVIYTSTIPASNHSPAFDQPLMLANFKYLSGDGAEIGLNHDHYFTSNSTDDNSLTHKKVTLTDLGSDPTIPLNTSSVLYTKTVSALSQLFFRNSSGVTQITSGSAAVVTPTTGTIPLAGGLILNYGNAAVAAASGSFMYSTAFSAPAYTILTSLTDPVVGSLGTVAVTISATTGFSWRANKTGTTLNFIAIGPA